MKKYFFILGAMIVLISCGKSKSKGEKSMGEEVCDCFKNAQALPEADANKMTDLNNCAKQQAKYYDELKSDEKKLADFSMTVANCAGK